MKGAKDLFKENVEASTFRAGGNIQRLETLINEEALLLAKFIRNENELWYPRMHALKN